MMWIDALDGVMMIDNVIMVMRMLAIMIYDDDGDVGGGGADDNKHDGDECHASFVDPDS